MWPPLLKAHWATTTTVSSRVEPCRWERSIEACVCDSPLCSRGWETPCRCGCRPWAGSWAAVCLRSPPGRRGRWGEEPRCRPPPGTPCTAPGSWCWFGAQLWVKLKASAICKWPQMLLYCHSSQRASTEFNIFLHLRFWLWLGRDFLWLDRKHLLIGHLAGFAYCTKVAHVNDSSPFPVISVCEHHRRTKREVNSSELFFQTFCSLSRSQFTCALFEYLAVVLQDILTILLSFISLNVFVQTRS